MTTSDVCRGLVDVDWEIFWDAVGAIGTCLAFGGLVWVEHRSEERHRQALDLVEKQRKDMDRQRRNETVAMLRDQFRSTLTSQMQLGTKIEMKLYDKSILNDFAQLRAQVTIDVMIARKYYGLDNARPPKWSNIEYPSKQEDLLKALKEVADYNKLWLPVLVEFN